MDREERLYRRTARLRDRTERQIDRMNRDYAMSSDRRRDYAYANRDSRASREYAVRGPVPDYNGYDRAYRDGHYERSREYAGVYGSVPFRMTGTETYPDARDYRDGSAKLETKDLDTWISTLLRHLDTDEKETFKMEKVIKRAKEMGDEFDKYSEDELYATTLMAYTDYKAVTGRNGLDASIHLAKGFLCDSDAAVQYGEKLATYYDCIVVGD